jgi:hypothetical protein
MTSCFVSYEIELENGFLWKLSFDFSESNEHVGKNTLQILSSN